MDLLLYDHTMCECNPNSACPAHRTPRAYLRALGDYAKQDEIRTKRKRDRVRARHALTSSADGYVRIEHIDRDVVFVRDRGICYLCGKSVDPSDWHLDHVIPLSKGGDHLYENVKVTHPLCNLKKGNRLV